jgi:hypothetical protein
MAERAVPETRDSVGTLIKPASAFAEKLGALNLWLPSNGAKTVGAIAFSFDTTRSPEGMLLLFDRDPGALVDGRLKATWSQAGCVGGIASMAGMSWNGVALLDGNANEKGFHACGASEHEPIDLSRPVTTSDLKDGQKYWWVVVGYDARFQPTASSPVYFFTWRRP